jgi:hypothetical protein
MTKPCIYSLTFFQGQRQTIPSVEYTGLSATTIIERVAPEDGAHILTDKALAPHFLPCPLQVAPYIGKTAKRFPVGNQGKQRSSRHVTESAWFAFDCDGITLDDSASILCGLDGTVYCAFSTFSHGEEAGKVRMRVLLFLDRVLAPAEWTAVWHVLNAKLFGGKADDSTASMSQCAAVWTSHADREAQSFRHVGKGEPLSADTLIALAPKPKPRQAPPSISKPTPPGAQRARYEEALQWLDAGPYVTWQRVLMYLRAAVEFRELAEAEGREVWLTWSATAPAERQARNDDARYSPAARWDRKPTLNIAPKILIGSLFKKSRDEAERCVKLELPGKLSPRAYRAAIYLRKFHPATFQNLKAAA